MSAPTAHYESPNSEALVLANEYRTKKESDGEKEERTYGRRQNYRSCPSGSPLSTVSNLGCVEPNERL